MTLGSPLPLNNDHAQSVVICAVVFPALATISVAGRFTARHMKRIGLEADDWIILLALVIRHSILMYQRWRS